MREYGGGSRRTYFRKNLARNTHGFFNLLKQVGQDVGEEVGHENLSGTEVGRIFPVKRDLAGDFPESSNQTSRLSKLNSPRDSRSNDYNHHYNPIQSRQIPKIPRIRSPKSEWGKTSRSEWDKIF